MNQAKKLRPLFRAWLIAYTMGLLMLTNQKQAPFALDLWTYFMFSGIFSEIIACIFSRSAYQMSESPAQAAKALQIWSWIIAIPGSIILSAGIHALDMDVIGIGIVMSMFPLLLDTWTPSTQPGTGKTEDE